MNPEISEQPTEKKLFIETYGCQMNVADSEVVAAIMEMGGYTLTDNEKDADAVFVNTCSIRENAEQKVIQRLDYFNSLKKKRKGAIIIRNWTIWKRHSTVLCWLHLLSPK